MSDKTSAAVEAVKPQTVSARIHPDLNAWLDERKWTERKEKPQILISLIEDFARANGYTGEIVVK